MTLSHIEYAYKLAASLVSSCSFPKTAMSSCTSHHHEGTVSSGHHLPPQVQSKQHKLILIEYYLQSNCQTMTRSEQGMEGLMDPPGHFTIAVNVVNKITAAIRKEVVKKWGPINTVHCVMYTANVRTHIVKLVSLHGKQSPNLL